MHWYINDEIDLEDYKPREKCQPEQLMLPGDNQGHAWNVSVLSGGIPADITGQTVQGFFTRADGNTVVVSGSAHGNVASVVLPRDVYLVRGALRAVMRLGDSVSVVTDPVVTLADRQFYVLDGVGSNLIDPAETFPTVSGLAEDVDDLDDAVDALGDSLTALTAATTGTTWVDLGHAEGVSTPTSTFAEMGMDTGCICAYRVEDGHHVYAHAKVALSFTFSDSSATKLNGSAISSSYCPTKRIIRYGTANGQYTLARAYVTPEGDIYLESIYTNGGAQSSFTVTWTDILIDWFV